MANVFRDSTAPYILVLVLTLTGWMFNSAIENATKLRIVEYRIENGKDADVFTKTLFLSNRSLTGSVNAGGFVLTCVLPNPQTPCLAKLPSVKVEAQFLSTGNVTLASNPTVLTSNSVGFPALIPPRGEVGYRIGVADSSVPIRLVYNVDYDPIAKTQPDLEIVLIEDKSFDWRTVDSLSNKVLPFLFANYITLLLFGIIILLCFTGLWIIVEFFRLAFGSRPNPKEKMLVKVTIEGRTHEATIEEI